MSTITYRKMPISPSFKKNAAVVLFLFALLCAFAWQGRVVDQASAAAKTKTIVFFVGSVVSTTAVASGGTTTFSFTIALPDMVPDTQPIRSAYIAYNAWEDTVTGISASTFTLNKQGGSAQTLTSPKQTGLQTEQQLSIRLNATAAMRTLIGNTSGTYAMTFTASITGPTRIGENAELYITYDYDPLATKQVNTVYQWVYSTSTVLGTTAFTSSNFNLNLPENSATTTFAVGASTTNDFWIEYRGFMSTSSPITASVAWNAEATSAATFTETTQEFSFLLLYPPKTANTSPNAANNFTMISSVAGGVIAPSAVAVATYSFNFPASVTLRKTIQVLLTQSSSTVSTSTINATTSILIPETSPSSTDAFLLGRLNFSTSSAPGINAYATTTGCTVTPTTTPIATGTQQTKNTGSLTAIWEIGGNTNINTSGTWNICSSFTRSAVSNIPGLELFLSYNYANNFSAGTLFNTNLSFLAQSNLSPTGTTFASTGINASIVNASTTADYSWLDAEYDNDAAGTTNQVLTLGIGGGTTTAYTFVARNSTARRSGATFSTTSTIAFSSNTITTVQCSVACVNDAAYDVFGFTQMLAGNIIQTHYHWRNNNGSETSATAAANEDTAATMTTGSVIRLRIGVNNAGDVSSTAAFRLEYQVNATSGAWTQLATSTVGTAAWQMATSSFVTDDTATTNIATSTGGTDDTNAYFLSGEVVASTSRNQTNSYVLTGIEFSEDEFTIKPTTNVATGTTYYFRVSNAGTALGTYSVYPAITVVVPTPTVSAVVLNSAGSITLTPNATTSITVVASATDPGGPGNILYATGTIYRTSLGGNCTANNSDCYQLGSSSCAFSGSTSTVTCTAGMWYFSQSTGNASSSFPSDSWTGAITVTNAQVGTATATSTTQNVNVLTAINVTTSSINYGTISPLVTSGISTTTITNAGNSSTTVQVSAVTILTDASNTIGADYQHYATSSFVWGGSEPHLSTSSASVSGFFLYSPTSTTNVQSSLYWALQPPGGTPTGTYSGTNQFTASFTPSAPAAIPTYANNGVSCGSTQSNAVTSYTCPLPNTVGSGNAIVVFAQWSTTSDVATTTDDGGDTYTKVACGTSGDQAVCAYVALNVSSTARNVTLNLKTSTTFVSMAAYEFYNVATAGATDGNCIADNTASTASCSTSITPTVPDDLLLFWSSQDGSATATTTWTAGTSPWTLKTADDFDNTGMEYQVDTATSTITPSMGMGINQHFDGVGIALKAATAGTPPSGTGIHVNYVQHDAVFNQPTGTTLTFQFPCSGNLIVPMWLGANSYDITGIADNASNTYNLVTPILSSGGDIETFYAGNASCSSNLTVTATTNGNDTAGSTLEFFDVSGAATSPLDTVATSTGDQGSSGNLTTDTIAPTTQNGLVLWMLSVESHTMTGLTSPTGALFDAVSTNPILTISPPDENAGLGQFYNAATSSETWINTENGDAVLWDSEATAFKAQGH